MMEFEVSDASSASSAEENANESSENEQEEEVEEVSAEDRTTIQTELREMSFADLIKLKEKLGATVYNEAMFGEDGQRRRKRMPKAEFKRENKNRPREMTTKKQVPLLGAIASKRSKIDDNGPRDPRFDTRCGEFDRDKFKQDYEFVNEIRQKEAATLREQLRETTDDEEKKKIKLLLQRMKNQECEEKKLKERKELQRADKSKVNVALKDDKKPFFVSKREAKAQQLVKQYLELKNSGRLNKHIERRRKKNTARDRKKYKFD